MTPLGVNPGMQQQYRHRPFSAGDHIRRVSFGTVTSRPTQDSSLKRGIIGVPPPLIRNIGFLTAEEVERLLAARNKEIILAKRKLHLMTKRYKEAETTIADLEAESSKLRQGETKIRAELERLKAKIAQLEADVRQKEGSLHSVAARQRRSEYKALEDISRATERARILRIALNEGDKKIAALTRRAENEETKVEDLTAMLKEAKDRTTEAQNLAAEDLASRIAAHEFERGSLVEAGARVARENNALKLKLEAACQGLREKQEAEREMEKLIREFQAWREKVATGEIIEMPQVEAKRLRMAEEQVEVLQKSNSVLRSQLSDAGRLLAGAERSFDSVRQGLGNATGTVSELSACLDAKEKGLLRAEQQLRRSRAEADKLKKCVTSLQEGFIDSQKRVKGRERALSATKRGMEDLARRRQEEAEALQRETVRRSSAEQAAEQAAAKIDSLRRRAEEAEDMSRELDAERRVLLQHLASARKGASSSLGAETDKSGEICGREIHQQQTTRSLLERAVSDWAVKMLLGGTHWHGGTHRSKRKGVLIEDEKTSESEFIPSSSQDRGSNESFPGEKAPCYFSKIKRTGTCSSRESDSPTLEVVRVFQSSREGNEDPDAGWRWDLVPTERSRDSRDMQDAMSGLDIRGLGQRLRDLGVLGDGGRTALAAVARVFNAFLLTRQLAAKQCAEVRTELARAVSRLFTRATIDSGTQMVAREAANRNLALIIRLIDMELRCWRVSLKDVCPRPREINGYSATTVSSSHEDDDAGNDNDSHSSSDRSPRKRGRFSRGTGGVPKERAATARGITLSLDGVGLQDETLCRVVHKLLRHCTLMPPELEVQIYDDGEDDSCRKMSPREGICSRLGWSGGEHLPAWSGANRVGMGDSEGSTKGDYVVPLERLLLRGNFITDAGAKALCPLIETSPTLMILDLRGNPIGRKGVMALRKALASNPWVYSVTREDLLGKEDEAELPQEMAGGIVLRARRRPKTTVNDRAKAYAFSVIPPSSTQRFQSGNPRADSLPWRSDSDSDFEAAEAPPGSELAHIGKVPETSYGRCDVIGSVPSRGCDMIGCASEEAVTTAHHSRKHILHRLLEEHPGKSVGAISPTCTIDLRGCSRRLTPTTPVAPLEVEEEQSLGATVSHDVQPKGYCCTLDASASAARFRSSPGHDRGSLGGRKLETTRLKSAVDGKSGVMVTEEEMGVNYTDRCVDHVSANVLGAKRAPRRRGRHRRQRSLAASADLGPSHEDEALDLDDLKSLLSASRKIFGETETLGSSESYRDDTSAAPVAEDVAGSKRAQGDDAKSIIGESVELRGERITKQEGGSDTPLTAEPAPSCEVPHQRAKAVRFLDSRESGVIWERDRQNPERGIIYCGSDGGALTDKDTMRFGTVSRHLKQTKPEALIDQTRYARETRGVIYETAGEGDGNGETPQTQGPADEDIIVGGVEAPSSEEDNLGFSESTDISGRPELRTNEPKTPARGNPPDLCEAGNDAVLGPRGSLEVLPESSEEDRQMLGTRDPHDDAIVNRTRYNERSAARQHDELNPDLLRPNIARKDSRAEEETTTIDDRCGEVGSIDPRDELRVSVGTARFGSGDDLAGRDVEPREKLGGRGGDELFGETGEVHNLVSSQETDERDGEPGQLLARRIATLERALKSRQ